MVKDSENIDKEVLDLQVFITRSPSQTLTKHRGLPSYFISSEGFRDLGIASPASVTNNPVAEDYSPSLNRESFSSHKYIAVANSCIVTEISTTFELEEVFRIIQKIDQREAKLVECMDFGIKLFNFLFQGPIRDLFRELNSKDQILRLTVSSPIAELAVLPWELMCDVKPGSAPQFLCFQPQIRFCRALHLFDRSRFEAKKQLGDTKIRFLLATANPMRNNYLDVGTEERLIRFVVSASQTSNDIELKVLHDASVNSLRETLLAFKPHILHFSGHGGYRDNEDLGYIILASKDNPQHPENVNSYRFSAIVQESNCVQLAFLSTCHGAAGDEKSAFSGVAQLLHANGVGEVAALNFAVLDRTGHAILANFYQYLLRYGLTVEESIANVRKLLFINGYSHSESFGLTLYQGNSSLHRKSIEKLSTINFSDGRDFDRTVDEFEARILSKKVASMRISELLRVEEIEELFKELKPTPEEVFLTIKVFGEPDIGFEALREVSELGLDRILFLKISELAKRLALEPNEGKLFSTVFILDTPSIGKEGDKDTNQHTYKVAQKIPKKFFKSRIKEIARTASTVNGQTRAFVLQGRPNTRDYKYFVADISEVSPGSHHGIGGRLWSRICYLVDNSGCALIVTGDGRVKLAVHGQQISEYRTGIWRKANLKEFERSVSSLSNQCSLEDKLLLDVLNKCILASEQKKGLTFLIQQETDLIKKCHAGYRQDLTDLAEKRIFDFDGLQYIDRIKGLDNAIILSQDGYTLAVSATISIRQDVEIEPIPGTGSRHFSAQGITKETDAVAFVVSEDRPITIFYNGKIVFRAE